MTKVALDGDIFTPKERALMDALLEEAKHFCERPDVIATKKVLDSMLRDMKRESETSGDEDEK